MLFAAGYGTRLGQLTQHTPKALALAGGKPLLQHVIEKLKTAEVTDVIINLHHLGEQIQNFLKQNESFGVKITFSAEPQILGTGGGLKQVEQEFINETCFIVHNCDVYSEIDLPALIAAHKTKNAVATLAIMRRETDRPLWFGRTGNLIGWENKKDNKREILMPDTEPKAFGFSGIEICSPRIFDFMRAETGSFSITRAWFNAIRAGEAVQGYDMGTKFWVDAGTPSALAELDTYLAGK